MIGRAVAEHPAQVRRRVKDIVYRWDGTFTARCPHGTLAKWKAWSGEPNDATTHYTAGAEPMCACESEEAA